MKNQFDYVRNYYGVPARRGGRVLVGKEKKSGRITSGAGHYINIRLDGEKHSNPYHPTWEIEYTDGEESHEDDDDWLCLEEGGSGPCRMMACEEWGGDGLCLLYMGVHSRMVKS